MGQWLSNDAIMVDEFSVVTKEPKKPFKHFNVVGMGHVTMNDIFSEYIATT
jgi:hypothetical protein